MYICSEKGLNEKKAKNNDPIWLGVENQSSRKQNVVIATNCFNYSNCVMESSVNGSSLKKERWNVGTYQNFEIEIFAEYKYTLNELLVQKKCFSKV